MNGECAAARFARAPRQALGGEGQADLPRERANRDIGEAIAHYLGEDGEQAELGFVDAMRRACAHHQPSPRHERATRYAPTTIPNDGVADQGVA